MYWDSPGRTSSRGRAARQSMVRALRTPSESTSLQGRGAAEVEPLADVLTPETAFDALYVYAAPDLIHQAYLLTGWRRLASEATEHAFHQAWENWPEVALDPDPVGWVRERAHEYALAPWHRFRRPFVRRDARAADPVLTVFQELPPRHRRAALLCDGLGLSVADAAAETQASTDATLSRLLHARTAIGRYLTDHTLGGPRQWLQARVEEGPAAAFAHPRSVRLGGERRLRILTRTVYTATAALVGLIVFTVITTPDHYEGSDRPSTAHGRTRPTPQTDRDVRAGTRDHPSATATPRIPGECLGPVDQLRAWCRLTAEARHGRPAARHDERCVCLPASR
ncbi:RNA polymerase subunit sigma-24 [Streptomyces cinnabarinus]|uniref:RNA polymerase subunit sigma-24 n=1 Tax=Streptomyces cinnabarinus TaxID=67287 RepID=A0ABY7K3R9_9ACTN|nr:RNA polymerase subunit sigma-24 [Streptomyces cinnabarinus]WAZ19126.1 RNA polymerase subunit sigma-24 [Streptomyces cinnabarinus]